jgi:aspartyl protease family protein
MMMWLGALGLLAALLSLFQLVGPDGGGVVQTVNESGRAMIVLQRDRSGHYVADGEINGFEVTFLVDTGATDVALPEAAARRMGLEFGPEMVVMTAAGPMKAWMTRLDRVSLGGLALTNVRGTITRGPLDEVLLGMSFLRHFRITQQGDRLLIESEG